MSEKIILLTGATGYLGSHLASALVAAGYHLIVLKRKSSSLKKIDYLNSFIHFYDIENLNYNLIFEQHENIYAIIHTATCYGRHEESINEIFTANTAFPLQLMDAGTRAGVKIFFNTDTVLDKYLNLYSFSKNQLLEWGKFFSKNKGLNFINIRLEHFYGANDDPSKFSTHIIHACMKNKKEIKLTKGEQTRDFIHIDDVVSAYIILLSSINKIKRSYFELDIGSGHAISIKEFVEKIHALTHSKSLLNFGALPYREEEVMHSQANVAILKELGWKCRHDIDSGLREVINMESIQG